MALANMNTRLPAKRATLSSARRSNSLVVQNHPLDQLALPQRRPRKHSDRQIAKLSASIAEFGFLVPVLIDGTGEVIVGTARVLAARQMNLTHVPAILIDHLSKAQIKAFRIADNRLTELGEWDREELRLEFEAILEIDSGFELELSGFETAEIDFFLEAATSGGEDNPDPADEIPETGDGPAVTRTGDLWLIKDRHKILCGDAKAEASYRRLLAGVTARMAFTDPPYNVSITSHAGGLGQTQHREFFEASGEMSAAAFATFLNVITGQLEQNVRDGAILYVCMDWRSIEALLRAGREADLSLINLCVWNKTNGGMGSLYRSKHELICVFKKGKAPHINNVQLGSHGRYRTNVWDYQGVNSFGAARMAQLQSHPTVKPVALVEDAIKDCTRRGDLVLDPFLGSGTTLMAAEKCGRRCCGLEIDPVYVDTALRRFARRFGQEAIHAGTGLTFSELAAQRQAEQASANDQHEPAGSGPVRYRPRPRAAA